MNMTIGKRFNISSKIFAGIGSVALVIFSMIGKAEAQTIEDAYRLSWQTPVGTARSTAMGQAGVALGGDMGFVFSNPAASAIYRYNEVTFSPILSMNSTDMTYLGNKTNDSKTTFGISNFGMVGSFKTGAVSGLKSWSLSIAYNRLNDFNSSVYATGRTAESSYLSSMAAGLEGTHGKDLDITDSYDPFVSHSWKNVLAWNASLLDTLPGTGGREYKGATENLVGASGGFIDIVTGGELDQRYTSVSKGNVSEASLNIGGNFDDILYIGATIGIQSIYYRTDQSYSEFAVNSSDFQTGFNSFTHKYSLKTTGTGINFRVGAIFTPVHFIRIGASISTPTWMYLHDEWEERMISDLSATPTSKAYYANLVSPLGKYDYILRTPFRWNIGGAFVFGQLGTVSIDYERTDYSTMKLKDPDYKGEFDNENAAIKEKYRAADNLRIGAELMATPTVAIRAGFQYYSSGIKGDDRENYIGSAGLGYSSKSGFFADLTYVRQLKESKADYQFYNSLENKKAPVANASWYNSRLVLTLGFRF